MSHKRKFPVISGLLLPLFLLLAPMSVFAANCAKKPDHPDCVDPPPDDGGNDTADPDWKIYAVKVDGNDATTTFFFSEDTEEDYRCYAFNPDLKGPGIAYGGFYDNDGYATCAQATTSVGGTVIDIKTLDVKVDESGAFSTIQLRGRNPNDGVVYESDAIEFADTGIEAPTSEVHFTLKIRTAIEMFSCGTSRKNKKTTCEQSAGAITLGDLEYCPLSSPNC